MLILYLTTLIAFVCADDAAVALQSPNKFVNRTSLSDRQTKSAVTIEFKLPQNVSFDQATYQRLKELILRKRATKLPTSPTIVTAAPTDTTKAPTTSELTTAESPTTESSTTEYPTTTTPMTTTTSWVPKRRRRRSETEKPSDDEEQFELDDIQFVKLDPEVLGGVQRVSVFINKEGISDDLLWEIIQELNKENSLETELNFEINEEGKDHGIYRGLPDDPVIIEPEPVTAASAILSWRFYLGFLILAVLFIVLIFAIFCVVRHMKGEGSEKPLIPRPIGSTSSSINVPDDDSGFPDGLIMRYEDAKLMQEEKNSYNYASPQITPM